MKLKTILDQILEQLENVNELDLNPDSVDLQDNPNEKSIHFTIGNLKYSVEFIKSLLENGKSIVEFKFLLINGPNKPKLSDFYDEVSYLTALRRSQIGISGTGSPINVFKHVLAAVKKYTETESPEYLTFSGDDDHEKLYKFTDRYIEKYIGYVPLKKNPINDSEMATGEHWFQRR